MENHFVLGFGRNFFGYLLTQWEYANIIITQKYLNLGCNLFYFIESVAITFLVIIQVNEEIEIYFLGISSYLVFYCRGLNDVSDDCHFVFIDALWTAQAGEQRASKENGRGSSVQESRFGTTKVMFFLSVGLWLYCWGRTLEMIRSTERTVSLLAGHSLSKMFVWICYATATLLRNSKQWTGFLFASSQSCNLLPFLWCLDLVLRTCECMTNPTP